MCGIAGLIDFKKLTSVSVLTEMTDALLHRGPNDSGYELHETENAQVGLGHRRLSILDLSSHGHQPMSYENVEIIFNGEVYNFKDIKAELQAEGYSFFSGSDTEVVLKAYHAWGIDCIAKFNGMFAIAVMDKTLNKLFLVRDRAGVKPLYWYHDNNGLFLFASELKSFHCNPRFKKQLNREGLALFLKYSYIPQPHTIYQSCYKLRAGHVLSIDLHDETFEEKSYWSVFDFYRLPKFDISEQEAIDSTEQLLISACNLRMIADVPVGVFLSGGYDSSVVAALVQSSRNEPIKTFTIGFNESAYNEANYAKQVSNHLGTDHIEYYCTPQDAREIIPMIPDVWDEPFADPSAIPTLLVSKLARKNVAVSLSADGGDEVFGGYSKYTGIQKKMSFFSSIPAILRPFTKHMLGNHFSHYVADRLGMFDSKDRFKRFEEMVDADPVGMLSIGSSIFSDMEINQLINHDVTMSDTQFNVRLGSDYLDELLAVDYATYQQDNILTKVDRATMAVSLEGREPLLDYRIVEHVSRIPNHFKIFNGEKKYLLKKIAHKYLPEHLMDRPKMGFGVPIFSWFKEDLRELLDYYLDENRLHKAGIFDPKPLMVLKRQYLEGRRVNIRKLWGILVFEMWRERWMM